MINVYLTSKWGRGLWLRDLKSPEVLDQGAPPDWIFEKVSSVRHEYDSSQKWAKFLSTIKESLTPDDFKILTLARQENLKNLVIQKLDRDFQYGFYFANLISGTIEHKLHVVLPKEVIGVLQEMGFPVEWDNLTAKAIRSANRQIALRSLGRLFRNLGVSVLEVFSRFSDFDSKVPRTLFIGNQRSEINEDPKKLNMIDFVRSGVAKKWDESSVSFVHADWFSKREIFDHGQIVVGRNPFESFRYIKSRWGRLKQLILEMGRTVSVGSMILKIWMKGSWAEKSLMEALVDIPRANRWFEITKPEDIFLTYSLYNSEPLWTLLASEHNCKTTMLFYHANHDTLTSVDEPPVLDWTPVERYLNCRFLTAWDARQSEYFQRIGYPSKRIKVTGPIIFAKYPEKTQGQVRIPTLAIFDVVPVDRRELLRRGLGNHQLSYESMTKFHQAIYESALKVFGSGGFRILIKPKRDPRKWKTNYADFLTQFAEKPEVEILDGFLNPFEVCNEATHLISPPFTSTTRLGHFLGLPSVWFDVSGKIREPSALPPRLMRSKDELCSWMSESHLQGKKWAAGKTNQPTL